MNWTLFAILAVANIPLFIFIGKYYFDGLDGFLECVKFWFTPDIVLITHLFF